MYAKILVIRFSSIGDIVLTTPVVRTLKKAYPNTEIHFLTKKPFVSLLEANPHLHTIHAWDDAQTANILETLRTADFDFILDLHHNLRSLRIRWALRRPAAAFPKANFRKYLLVKGFLRDSAGGLRSISHVVERYGETLRPLGISALDGEGLDIFLPEMAQQQAAAAWLNAPFSPSDAPLAVCLGATHATKRWLPAYFIETLLRYARPVVLLGGKDAIVEAAAITDALQGKVPIWNTVAQFDLLTSAALMRDCAAVLTHDTGFMHIAAAFHLPIVSLWGSTVPELGFTPYKTPFAVAEVTGLSCRPCSKIGFDTCPKGHFRCMKDLTPNSVLAHLQSLSIR